MILKNATAGLMRTYQMNQMSRSETNRPRESIRLHDSDFLTLRCARVQSAREAEPDVM